MNFHLSTIISVILLFVGMIALVQVGFIVGKHRLSNDPEKAKEGLGALEGAVFALWGFLIALTLTGSVARLDHRRTLIAEEANAIGTAYLRIDLLPAEGQTEMRRLFRDYLDSRIETYKKLPDMEAAYLEYAKSQTMQNEIWRKAVFYSGGKDLDKSVRMLLLPALNAMIDITTTRDMATKMHPPQIIYNFLFVLALMCCFFAGHSMAGSKKLGWAHIIIFAAVCAFTIYIILDLEYPRFGLFNISGADQFLVNLRASMK